MLATFVAYWPAMRNSFVWDDTALVLRDPLIRHWRLAPEAFREFLFLDATPSNFYRPLQRLTYTVDYALWGIEREGQSDKTGAPDTGDGADMAAIQRAPQPGWHFTSILFHGLAAVALWRLLRIWLGDGWWPLLGALVWALHPLHTSAVTYVSGRADSLAALCAFSALALVARAHAKGGLMPGDRAAAQAVIGATGCAFAALLSKESGVAALTLWLVWVLFKARRDKRAWMSWVGAAVISVGAYLALRSAADQTPVPASMREAPVAMRPVLAARALAEYATLFVAPHSLHMERDISIKPGADAATVRFRHLQTAGGVLVALGLFLWARWGVRRAPDVPLALACFVVTWLPISNLFKLNATVAEHWLYVPSAFLLAALVATILQLREGAALCWIKYGGAAWLVFLVVQTFLQQDYWREQRAFVEQTASRAGLGGRMMINLGQLEASAGHDAQALALYRSALVAEPDLAVAHFNIAVLAVRQKDYATAQAELAVAASSPMFEAGALVLRSNIEQATTGKPKLNLLAQAAAAAPRNWDVCRRLPEALLSIGDAEHAFEDLLRQREVRPYRAETFRLIARVLEQKAEATAKAGDLKEAASLLKGAVRAYGDAAARDARDEVSRRKLAEGRATL